ncbi:MAG: hypothetical protein ACI89L_002805 [Phycisphaerales bacterium]|jgi:hypothetical protein
MIFFWVACSREALRVWACSSKHTHAHTKRVSMPPETKAMHAESYKMNARIVVQIPREPREAGVRRAP